MISLGTKQTGHLCSTSPCVHFYNLTCFELMTFLREWQNFIPYRTEQWEEIRGDMDGWIKLKSAFLNLNSIASKVISLKRIISMDFVPTG